MGHFSQFAHKGVANQTQLRLAKARKLRIYSYVRNATDIQAIYDRAMRPICDCLVVIVACF